MNVSLNELTSLLQGTLEGADPATIVTGFASLREAEPGDLSFFYDKRYAHQLAATRATAVLIPHGDITPPPGVAGIRVTDPSAAFEKVVDLLSPPEPAFTPGIHPTAAIAEDVVLNPDKVCIGPNAVVESGSSLADGVSIGSGSYVGRNVQIGADTRLHPNVSVLDGSILGRRVIIHSGAVIGSDGFGYAFDAGRHRKIRQAGIVQIDDDVEIGSGTTVDRARFGRTWIGEGTKIDNLVQIGHNVVIGKHCIFVACNAIAGSAKIGDYVVVAAQSGIAGHVEVGSGITLAGRCGVTKDLPPGRDTYFGFPAIPVNDEKRRLASILRIPKLSQKIKELEKKLAQLTPPPEA